MIYSLSFAIYCHQHDVSMSVLSMIDKYEIVIQLFKASR